MVGRDELREYVRGSLWVLPGLSVLAALAVGAVLSSVRVGPRSALAFQGTPDDARTLLLTGGQEAPEAPAWAVPVPSRRSGYVQAVRPRALLPCAARHGVCVRLRPRIGEHIVAGTTLAWIWRTSPADPVPDPAAFARVLDSGVR
ncbi:MAG TPA: DUF2254 family protein, partial [Streptosporangiaceae bacterium]|nr:DUF2254 family protein [Streptosporangiaceae bacterium]